MDNLTCLRCGETLRFLSRERIQLGKTGWFLGDLPNLLSGALETGIIFVTVDCLLWNGNIMKLITSVLVVILNYVASKLLVFRR